jgi:hypothetical protein
LSAPETARAQSCADAPRTSFDVREDPFQLSAEERDGIVDTVHAFALTWDLRDEVNLPLLFIDGGPDDGLLFLVCNSTPNVGGTGNQLVAAFTRQDIKDYFVGGPFAYVMNQIVEEPNDLDTTSQARHFISNTVVRTDRLGDVRVVADLLVTLQYFGVGQNLPVNDATYPQLDYTGIIEAILTKEWGGVWKFRKLMIYMDVPNADADTFRGR